MPPRRPPSPWRRAEAAQGRRDGCPVPRRRRPARPE
jgi:hypothetical protein